MFIQQSIANSNGDMGPGETLFDLLKRKKKIALQNTLQQSRGKQNAGALHNIIGNQGNKNQKVVLSQNEINEDIYKDNIKKSFTLPLTIPTASTPKIPIQLSTPTHNSHTTAHPNFHPYTNHNSFISMISPMKKKMTNIIKPGNNTNEKQKKIGKLRTMEQGLLKKNIKDWGEDIKVILGRVAKINHNAKDKWHSIAVQLKPILKFVEASSHLTLSSKATQLRQKLPSFQQILAQLTTTNPSQLLQQFDSLLSNTLYTLQQQLKAQRTQYQLSQYTKIKNQHQQVVQNLSNYIQELQKNQQLLSKKLTKLQQQLHMVKTNNQEKERKQLQYLHTKITQLQQQILQYQQQIHTLSEQLSTKTHNQKHLQKALKDLTNINQHSQAKQLQQSTQTKTKREQFLLIQIYKIKQQFRQDMEQLTILYTSKQQQQTMIIEELNQKLCQMHKQRLVEKENENKMIMQVHESHQLIEKYRDDRQNLIKELNTMNQSLYQHWLALKDIKILSVRLKVFSKFGKIYQELNFNEQLFL